MKLLTAGVIVAWSATAGAVPVPSPARVPVVVELFTSEGCSSCPPADGLLSRLATEQPVSGVEIIPLGMHVTYWDQLGWKDPSSLQSATDRQQSYGLRFGEDRVYTPQAVIDGRAELVGSDERGVRAAIARAASAPHATLAFTAAIDGDAVVTTLAITGRPAVSEPLDVVFFVTEDDVTTVVKRGENGGRTLHHDAVVRQERFWDHAPGSEPARITIHGLKPEWKRDRLHAVVVLYGRKSHEIVGAASARLG